MIPWRFTVTTPLPPDEALARIKAMTDPKYNHWFPVSWRHKTPGGHYYRFGGKVDQDTHRFQIYSDPNSFGRSGLHYKYSGRIEMGMAETVVRGWVRAPFGWILFPIAIIGALWHDAAKILQHSWSMDTTKLASLAVAAVGVLIFWSISEARYAREQLREALSSPGDPRDRKSD